MSGLFFIREKLFEPFYRGVQSHDHRGAGLGLSLVRQIGRRHGGEVSCTETSDGRNSFTVTLPSIKT